MINAKVGLAVAGLALLAYVGHPTLSAAEQVPAAAEQVRQNRVGGRSETLPEERGSIRGRIHDAAGRPISGVAVSALLLGPGATPRQQPSTARTALTDGTGMYLLQGLPFGDYLVRASGADEPSFTDDPGHAPRSPARAFYVKTFYPGTTEVNDAQVVSLRAGDQPCEADFAVLAVPLARVAGRLISWSGAFDDGAHVALTPLGKRSEAFRQDFLGVSRITSDGAFVIDGVPPGEYVLKARSIPLRALAEIASTGRSSPLTASDSAEFGSARLSVDGEDIVDLTISMVRGGCIRGQVLLDGRDFIPAASERVLVAAIASDSDATSAGASEELVDAAGAFSIRGLVGQFVVRIRQLPKGIHLARVDLGGADVTDSGVSVAAGQAIADLVVVLTSRPSLLTGYVTTTKNASLQAVQVHVFSQESERWTWAATRYVATVSPNPDGSFMVKGLPVGRYYAVAVDATRSLAVDVSAFAALSRIASKVAIHDGVNEPLRLESVSIH